MTRRFQCRTSGRNRKGDALGFRRTSLPVSMTPASRRRCVASAPSSVSRGGVSSGRDAGHRFSSSRRSRVPSPPSKQPVEIRPANRCGKVRACELPVLSLDDPASDAAAQIGAEIELAKREDRAKYRSRCAGMADLAARLGKAWASRDRRDRERGQAGGSFRRARPQNIKNWGLCLPAAESLPRIVCILRTAPDKRPSQRLSPCLLR